VTGDAEVFKQHIAREDIGGGKLANALPYSSIASS
jgi:hypothetical protein